MQSLKISEDHKLKLQWFSDNRNKVISWSETLPGKNQLPGNVFLFSKPKGIYKPKESEYVLSIRVMLNSRYPDQEIIHRKDGSWSFRYHQEEINGKLANDLFTNKGLIACIRDGIPIGVAIQSSGKPDVSYTILGLAQVSELRDGFLQINGYSNNGSVITDPSYGPFTEEIDLIRPDEFDPKSMSDARNKVLREVVQRQGQKKFREGLLRVYNSCCVITKCNVPAVLEAAHITPYLGYETNNISNGLILRADIHTLWDLALIAIDPATMKIYISPVLEGSNYEAYKGNCIQCSSNENEKPSLAALQSQWDLFLDKLEA
jgi:putative restriction endonuclease